MEGFDLCSGLTERPGGHPAFIDLANDFSSQGHWELHYWLQKIYHYTPLKITDETCINI